MTPDQVVKYFGGPKASVALAAADLGIVPMTIYTWIRNGAVPYKMQCLIEKETHSDLIAERSERRETGSRRQSEAA